MITQKATILCLYEILRKYSDEDHLLSADKIREKLKIIYDVDMERRAIYRNIDALRDFGIDIEGYSDNREGYCLLDRTFELSEIRLLCDAIAASRMIRETDRKKIVEKLLNTQSIFQGRMLMKTVYVKDREPVLNPDLFYNIDTLNIAINRGCKVSLFPQHYDLDLKLVPASEIPLTVSPYATIWADGNYYLIAKQEFSDSLDHYQIDRLKNITLLEQSVDMIFGGLDPAEYARHFIFQNGESADRYELKCERSLLQELAELFGKDLSVTSDSGSEIQIRIRTAASRLKPWIMSHVSQCEILSPKTFRDEIRREIFNAYNKYW